MATRCPQAMNELVTLLLFLLVTPDHADSALHNECLVNTSISTTGVLANIILDSTRDTEVNVTLFVHTKQGFKGVSLELDTVNDGMYHHQDPIEFKLPPTCFQGEANWWAVLVKAKLQEYKKDVFFFYRELKLQVRAGECILSCLIAGKYISIQRLQVTSHGPSEWKNHQPENECGTIKEWKTGIPQNVPFCMDLHSLDASSPSLDTSTKTKQSNPLRTPTVHDNSTLPDQPTTSDKPTLVDKTTTSAKATTSDNPTLPDKTTTSAKATTSENPTLRDETTLPDNPTTSNEATTSVKATISDKPATSAGTTTSVTSTIPSETQTQSSTVTLGASKTNDHKGSFHFEVIYLVAVAVGIGVVVLIVVVVVVVILKRRRRSDEEANDDVAMIPEDTDEATRQEKVSINSLYEAVGRRESKNSLYEAVGTQAPTNRQQESLVSQAPTNKQQEPLDSQASINRQQEPLDSQASTNRQQEPLDSQAPINRQQESLDSQASTNIQQEPLDSQASTNIQQKPLDSQASTNIQQKPLDSQASTNIQQKPLDRQGSENSLYESFENVRPPTLTDRLTD
ncbi:nucleoporin NUP152-like [Portunus trituberculatus]|uniref:nucleoporin NUP152-like n=1 Tax=Portunus trituberculatus TaxID=210409 RepID=UPI001E1CB022|nr:nucleoporin NUP152-like [Portunus trituberculatus]